MARYSEQTIKSVNDNADIRDIIPGADPSKTKQNLDCPFCGAKKKFGVTHNSKYNSAKCFACGAGFANPISAWMHYQGYGSDKYPVAIEEVAKMARMTISTEEVERKEFLRNSADRIKGSFCVQQLEASGLTVRDVMAAVNDGKSRSEESPFQPGSFGPGFSIDPKGSDMVIRYYDLHGRSVKYTAKGSSTPKVYARVRYSNPELHQVGGKPMKYQTPTGAPSKAYIPQYIRERYQAKEEIETLFLQEGEKKAEKACKHGMPSIGIQGINNIGTIDAGLLQDIQDVIKTCHVRNVVLMMDSDWDDLHRNITVGDRVDKRPNAFAAAVIKFKQFMQSLRNINIEVEAWWGHVNADNTFCDKGIDDLLCNTLKTREKDLMADAYFAMHATNGAGEFVSIRKISTMTDMKIRDLWSLGDHQAFYSRHRKRLSEIPSFRIGGVRYKVENDKIVPISKYSSDVDIYSISENTKGEKKVSLNYKETMQFLGDSGFKRMVDPDVSVSDYELVLIDDGIVDRIPAFRVRDFIRQYILTYTKDPLVHEFFYAKLDNLLQDKKLEGLPIVVDEFSTVEPYVQRTYYNNGQVEITASGITPGKAINNVWRARIVPRKFSRVPIIEEISKVGSCYTIRLSEAAKKCEFLTYLRNTSNNYYPHNAPRDVTEDEYWEWNQHIVNKITAIGYLLAEWKPAAERKAVVIQDHLMSEVGQSFGGAGKSIVGNALSYIIPQVPIAGSMFKKDDQFAFSAVNKTTRNIFIDDIKPNFDFKHIYPIITGDMEVNPKGKDRYTIKVNYSPKVLLTTNHTINGASEGSTRRRIIYMEYSGWYNPDHTPVHDFGHMLFDDWDADQWNLFDNFMAECVMYYLRSFEESWVDQGVGVVPPPMKQIELRTLRQEMSETFLQWAEEYYDPSGPHLNVREQRNDVFVAFLDFAGSSGHGITRSNILRRIKSFCKYKGYDLNINKPNDKGKYYIEWKKLNPDDSFIGVNDKSGGKEYFTVHFPGKAPDPSQTAPF